MSYLNTTQRFLVRSGCGSRCMKVNSKSRSIIIPPLIWLVCIPPTYWDLFHAIQFLWILFLFFYFEWWFPGILGLAFWNVQGFLTKLSMSVFHVQVTLYQRRDWNPTKLRAHLYNPLFKRCFLFRAWLFTTKMYSKSEGRKFRYLSLITL